MSGNKTKLQAIEGGIYPTMLIAYTPENQIDYVAMEALIEWYIAEGVHGIFALCHSTEVHCLSLEERLEVARFVLKQVNGRVPVVMAGVMAYEIEEQIKEAKMFAQLKPDALVLMTNRLCEKKEDSLIPRMEALIDALPKELALGVYECPEPYKRVITDEELEYMAKSKKVSFIKDTCCDVAQMKRRAKIVEGSSLKLFNANCTTLHQSLKFGYAGFSGIMANFHPALYSWIYEHQEDSKAERLSAYLGVTSLVEHKCYPIPAKRYLKEYVGLPIGDACRSVEDKTVPTLSSELHDIYVMTQIAHELIKVPIRKY